MHQLLAENYYNNTITADIASSSWNIIVSVATPPINDKWFITISPWNLAKRETCFYSSVSWNNLTVKWINRIWWKTHSSWDPIQMMDVAEWFNFLSQNVQTVFYPERTWDLEVTIWGWDTLIWWTQTTLNDTVLSMTDNTTNKIYFDYSDSIIKTTTWSYWTNLLVYEITTAWWAITWIINRKPLSLTWLTWPKWDKWDQWDKWDTWSIAEAPTWQAQTIVDNVPLPDWWSVEIIWDTIKIIQTNWVYTIYSETSIITYDANDNQLSLESKTWVFATPVMTYTDWMTVNWTTWLISYTWHPAYKDKPNTFTATNTFEWTTIFKWAISTPYNVLSTATWNFTFDNAVADFQWITISWASDHICTFNNLVSWTKSLFVIQSGTGKLDFAIWTWCDTVVSVTNPENLLWTALYDSSVALPTWTYFFTFVVAETACHMCPPFKS